MINGKNIFFNNTKIIFYTSLLVLIVFILILVSYFNQFNIYVQDDFIFFKSLGFRNSSNNKFINESNDSNLISYEFNIKDNSFMNIDFLDVVASNIDFNRKIFPGSSGSFYIDVKSNKDINYRIDIFDLTKKPKNFRFEFDKYGFVGKNKIKRVKINWIWDYYIDENNDIYDTNDGMYLDDYSFIVSITDSLERGER